MINYLTVSKKLLTKTKNIFCLIVNNNGLIDEKIKTGDFLIVDSNNKKYKNGDLVVIKGEDDKIYVRKYKETKENVYLYSKSEPFFLDKNDIQKNGKPFLGKVIKILHKPVI